MNEKDKPAVATTTIPVTTAATTATGTATPTVPPPPKRSPGHRGADVKDTVAEMAAKAQEISMEAGSKMAAAMKDVIGAAAGLTGFVLESARDLLQYMVRRGQMTQEEADKLMREVEASHAKRKPTTPAVTSSPLRPPPRVEPTHTAPAHASHTSTSHAHTSHAQPSHAHTSHAPAPVHHHATPAKHAAPAKHAPAKAAAKKPAAKAAAKKHPVKAAAKPKPKAAAKAKRR
ncbi:MAG TPA: hypothetical protein VFP26_06635 [Gemmatimonadaceae bacterium]|nr:hypothetical protein [Gemmatimonadaceae bacterium]